MKEEEKNNLRKENKKKTLILALIAIVTLSLVAIGAAYAFFASQNTGKKDVNINAESGTTDVLSFSLNDKDVTSDQVQDEENTESDIRITANMDNFNEGNISVGDGVTGTATLIANNATNNAKDNYYVYLNIAKNELRYTNFKNAEGEILEGKEEDDQIVAPDSTHTTKVPELILTVTQPDDKGELTQIDGLDYKEDVDGNGLNGFDITEATGLIPIAKNYEITATGTEPTVKATQEWEIKITLINLDSSQNNNTGKVFSGKLILQKDQIIANLTDACGTTDTIGTCVKNFSNADYEYSHVIYHNSESLANSNITNKELNANDNSYRYSGSSETVKNYVCLDGTEAIVGKCTTDADLYRIIGFFPNDAGEYEMKLIKAIAGTVNELGDVTIVDGAYSEDNFYKWNYAESTKVHNNMWKDSNLNKVNLNDYYLNYIIKKEENLTTAITNHNWQVGGFGTSGYSADYNVKQVYDKELGVEKLTDKSENCYPVNNKDGVRLCNEKYDLVYPAEIGLPYISDYGYAAYTEAWNTKMGMGVYNTDAILNNNWMYIKNVNFWSISRNSNSGDLSWGVYPQGMAYQVYVFNHSGVRPVFYLDSSTKIAGGDGNHDNPFRLSWVIV